MTTLKIVFKIAALLCSMGGLYLAFTRQWQRSSLAWNIAAVLLWIDAFIP